LCSTWSGSNTIQTVSYQASIKSNAYMWQTLEVSMAAVVKMEEDEFRAVIKHFYLKKWTLD